MIVGIDTSDDAGVYKLSSDIALVQTLDFLTPVTNSPYEFGQIAAANSLSDVYAMGGTPLTAMNIVCFSCDELPEDVLGEVLKGGLDKIDESGAVLVGGHSVDDKEFKYGLSVTGTVHPDKIWTNKGLCTGDALILTKPLGTGIIATAIKAKLAKEDVSNRVAKVMSQLNNHAAQIFKEHKINACTDITGFGLAGHLFEMAKASKKKIKLLSNKVPIIEGAEEFAMMGMIPAGAHKNRAFCQAALTVAPNVERACQDILFDPQTSGGLVASINKTEAEICFNKLVKAGVNAEIIGEVYENDQCGLLEIL